MESWLPFLTIYPEKGLVYKSQGKISGQEDLQRFEMVAYN